MSYPHKRKTKSLFWWVNAFQEYFAVWTELEDEGFIGDLNCLTLAWFMWSSRESMSGVKRKSAALSSFWLCKFLKWNPTRYICLWSNAPSKKGGTRDAQMFCSYSLYSSFNTELLSNIKSRIIAKNPKNQPKFPWNPSDNDSAPKGAKCHFLTNVRAGSILHSIWEEANLNSCHYDPRMILMMPFFLATHLFTHPYPRR